MKAGRHVEVLDSGAAGVGLRVGRRLREADCAPGVECPGAATGSFSIATSGLVSLRYRAAPRLSGRPARKAGDRAEGGREPAIGDAGGKPATPGNPWPEPELCT